MWSHSSPADFAQGSNSSGSERSNAGDSLGHRPSDGQMLFKRPTSEEPNELHLRALHPHEAPFRTQHAREGMFSQDGRHAPQLVMGSPPPFTKDMSGWSQNGDASEYYRSTRSSSNMNQHLPASGRQSPHKSSSRIPTGFAGSRPGTPTGGGNWASPSASRAELPYGSSWPTEVMAYGQAPYQEGSSMPLKFVKGDQNICPHPGCEQTFTRPNDLSRHMATVHVEAAKKPVTEAFTCRKCGDVFSRPDSRKRHEVSNACGKRKASLTRRLGQP